VVEILDEKYWSSRYQSNQIGWDIGSVSNPIKQYCDQLVDKSIKILIPGAGNSHEAEYLINLGFENVFVCDLAIEPLLNLKTRCPKITEKNLLHCDFFELDSNTFKFDLIIEQTFFCALDPSLREKYFQKMNSVLIKNGK
jgi:thiopurine S-methyltransferase